MTHIDRATAIKLASDAGMENIDHIKWRGSYNKCTVPEKFEIDSVVRLCNSAIRWHIAQAAQVHAIDTSQERVENSAEIEHVTAQPAQTKLWLWKNFVDGKPEYWAFDNAFPVHMDGGDPQTIGEPCGYALFKPSRQGRSDVSEAEVLRRIAACSQTAQVPQLTDERILELAHRKATRYAHSAIGTAEPAFAFNTVHMIDFARAIEKEARK